MMYYLEKYWSREDKLSLKNRCMITIAGLIGKGLLDNSFKYHLMIAKKHGITKEEMAEIITHLALEVPGENTSNEWCEKVTDEEYNKLPE